MLPAAAEEVITAEGEAVEEGDAVTVGLGLALAVSEAVATTAGASLLRNAGEFTTALGVATVSTGDAEASTEAEIVAVSAAETVLLADTVGCGEAEKEADTAAAAGRPKPRVWPASTAPTAINSTTPASRPKRTSRLRILRRRKCSYFLGLYLSLYNLSSTYTIHSIAPV
jgi:hypothetical protein